MVVLVVPSPLNPITPGDITKVPLPITSAITPEPGAGSVPSSLLASLFAEVESVYNLTHASLVVRILKRA